MRDAFPIVAKLGDRLQGERTGWRDTKALIMLAAQAGCWDSAAALADALGVSPDAQEQVYREAYGHAQPRNHPVSEPGESPKETNHVRTNDQPRVSRHRDHEPRQAAG